MSGRPLIGLKPVLSQLAQLPQGKKNAEYSEKNEEEILSRVLPICLNEVWCLSIPSCGVNLLILDDDLTGILATVCNSFKLFLLSYSIATMANGISMMLWLQRDEKLGQMEIIDNGSSINVFLIMTFLTLVTC